jgi:hypothetical protein
MAYLMAGTNVIDSSVHPYKLCMLAHVVFLDWWRVIKQSRDFSELVGWFNLALHIK